MQQPEHIDSKSGKLRQLGFFLKLVSGVTSAALAWGLLSGWNHTNSLAIRLSTFENAFSLRQRLTVWLGSISAGLVGIVVGKIISLDRNRWWRVIAGVIGYYFVVTLIISVDDPINLVLWVFPIWWVFFSVFTLFLTGVVLAESHFLSTIAKWRNDRLWQDVLVVISCLLSVIVGLAVVRLVFWVEPLID